MLHNEKYMTCCFVVYYGQSLFFRSPSSENARDRKMTTRVTEGARDRRGTQCFFFLAALFSRAQVDDC